MTKSPLPQNRMEYSVPLLVVNRPGMSVGLSLCRLEETSGHDLLVLSYQPERARWREAGIFERLEDAFEALREKLLRLARKNKKPSRLKSDGDNRDESVQSKSRALVIILLDPIGGNLTLAPSEEGGFELKTGEEIFSLDGSWPRALDTLLSKAQAMLTQNLSRSQPGLSN